MSSQHELPAVFLSTTEQQELGGLLGLLVRAMKLDVYSTSLLGARARVEMEFMAVTLLVVFAFDLGAWTLLFNAVLHSELMAVTPWSVLAVAAGIAFALIIFLYERQFLTTDSYKGWRALVPATLLRLAVIGASAIITAQPIELLFFRTAIEQRVHQEGIRREVITRRDQLADLREELAELKLRRARVDESLANQDETLQLAMARQDLRDKRAAVVKLEVEAKVARQTAETRRRTERNRRDRVQQAEQRVAEVERATDGPEIRTEDSPSANWAIQQAKQALTAARSSLEVARRARINAEQTARRLGLEVEIANGEWTISEEQVDKASTSYRLRRKAIEQEIDQRTARLDAEHERIHAWIRKLRSVEPDSDEIVVESGTLGSQPTASSGSQEVEPASGAELPSSAPESNEPFRYTKPSYHFFAQLRVLDDLIHGRPPEWSGVSSAEAEQLGEIYSLSDPKPCPEVQVPTTLSRDPSSTVAPATAAAPSPCDRSIWQRHQVKTDLMMRSWLVVYGIALIIPLMVIAVKLLMGPELKKYYSALHQAYAGQPDTQFLRQLERDIRRREQSDA